jgi:hypothetical protein
MFSHAVLTIGFAWWTKCNMLTHILSPFNCIVICLTLPTTKMNKTYGGRIPWVSNPRNWRDHFPGGLRSRPLSYGTMSSKTFILIIFARVFEIVGLNFILAAYANDVNLLVCKLIHEILLLTTKLSTTLHTILQGTHIQHQSLCVSKIKCFSLIYKGAKADHTHHRTDSVLTSWQYICSAKLSNRFQRQAFKPTTHTSLSHFQSFLSYFHFSSDIFFIFFQ